MAIISDIFTANAIANEIAEAVGDLSETTKNQAYRSINRALRIISRKGNWPFFRSEDVVITTENNVESYKLKSRVKLPKYLHMRDPARKLIMMDLRDLRLAYPNNTETTGTPLYWRVKGYSASSESYEVALWPIPDGEYTIYMDADNNPALIETKNDDIRSTGLPEEMIETVIALGTALVYEKKGDAQATEKMAVAMAMLDDDYYRLGSHIDDDLRSREYAPGNDIRLQDPVLPGRYDGL